MKPLGSVLVLLLLLAPCARAEDPLTVDVLAALGLQPEREVAGLGVNGRLACTVVDAQRARMYEHGERVFVLARGDGSFRVVPDAPGLTACVVGFTVHVVDLLSPARVLEALGLEPSDDPIPASGHRSTKIARVEPLRERGVSTAGVGGLVTVRNRGGGTWDLSTFGRKPGTLHLDVAPLFAPRAVGGDLLARATVVLRPETLPVGGRLLARVADPEVLAAAGLRDMPAGHLVLVEKTDDGAFALLGLSPGFPRRARVEGTDFASLGLDDVRVCDLPVGGSLKGRVTYGWKAAKAGLVGARAKDEVEVAHGARLGYVLRNLAPKRPGSVRLAD